MLDGRVSVSASVCFLMCPSVLRVVLLSGFCLEDGLDRKEDKAYLIGPAVIIEVAIRDTVVLLWENHPEAMCLC